MAAILVVDDNAEVRSVTRRLLEREGHDVVEAEDGLAALNRITNRPFDAAMVDLYLPGIDGLDLIPKLLIQVPGLKIIAMSGGYQGGRGLDLLRAAERVGATTTLAKPFTLVEMNKALDQALR